jgi:hypothetical protein
VAIAIDASSPPVVGGSTAALQTAAFSPPAGSVLVVCIHGYPKRTWTITNTGPTLTWSTVFQNQSPSTPGPAVSAFQSVLTGGATNMAVTATGTLTNDFAVKLYVVTGADTATPVGASNTGNGDTTDTIAKSITPQVANSMGFVVAEVGFSVPAGATTSPDTTFDAYDVFQNVNGGSGYRLMGAAGSTQTFTVDAPGTGTTNNWGWGVFEIRSAPVVVTPAPASIDTHMTARPRASLW